MADYYEPIHRASKHGFIVDDRLYTIQTHYCLKLTRKQITGIANISRLHLLKLPDAKTRFPELCREQPSARLVAQEMAKTLDKSREINHEQAHARVVLHCLLWLLNPRKVGAASYHYGEIVKALNDIKTLKLEPDIYRGQKQLAGASRGGTARASTKKKQHERIRQIAVRVYAAEAAKRTPPKSKTVLGELIAEQLEQEAANLPEEEKIVMSGGTIRKLLPPLEKIKIASAKLLS